MTTKLVLVLVIRLIISIVNGTRTATKYIDDLFWVKYDDWLYFKPEYMNKESKNVKYAKLDSCVELYTVLV